MKGKRKVSIAASALVIAAGSSIAATQAEVGVTDKEIVIATCNPLSGQSETAGKQTNIGVQTFIKWIER